MRRRKRKERLCIGLAVKAAGSNQNIVIIQFLEGKNEESEMSRRLEPEIKVFSFEKSEKPSAGLQKKRKRKRRPTCENGVNFAKRCFLPALSQSDPG